MSDTESQKPVYHLYGVAEAKKNFAEMLRQAQDGIVIILKHNRPVAVIIGVNGVRIQEIVRTFTMREIRALIETHRSNQPQTEES